MADEPMSYLEEMASFADLSYPTLKQKKPIYSAVVYGNPATKKNSQQILTNKKTGRQFISQSNAYKRYERSAVLQLHKLSSAINKKVQVKCLFYRDSMRRVDLTNLLEAIDDILVKAGIIKDDDFKILVSHDGSRVFVDRDNPRTEIFIYMEEDDERL